jgi:hypothetical protein
MDHYDKYKACIQKDSYVRDNFKSIPAKFKKNNEIKDLIELMENKFSIDSSSHLPLASETLLMKEKLNNDLKKRKTRKLGAVNEPLQDIDQNMDVDIEINEVRPVEEIADSVKRKRKHSEIS